MESVRQKIENPADLLAAYKAASNVGAGLAAFVPSVALCEMEEGNIKRAGNSYARAVKDGSQEDKNKKTHEAYNIIKNRFHKSGFIALLFVSADNPQAREVIDILAINVGLKSNAPLSADGFSAMRSLFLRVIKHDAIKDRQDTFAALINIFRDCKKIDINSDFYKMVAIALAQFMLTNSCFTESRWKNDISIPKTWMLLLMEARVFIGSLSDAEDRHRVLSVFQKAIKEQERKFVKSVSEHSQIVKMSDEKQEKNIERFQLTLADCNELFDPIEPLVVDEDESASSVVERDRVDSAVSRASSVGDIDSSLKDDVRQAKFDLKAFRGAKAQFKEMLQFAEGGTRESSAFIIATVDGYLRRPLLTQQQFVSDSVFSPGSMNTLFGGNKAFRMAHPSLVWVQLVTYARLLAEQSSECAVCLGGVYKIIGEMAEYKGWGQMNRHFCALGDDLKKMPLLQISLDDDPLPAGKGSARSSAFDFGTEGVSSSAAKVVQFEQEVYKL
jgi:hypothetical protein